MAEPNRQETIREVSWALDGTHVDATLVRPDGPGPFPGVVMVAGSGPTDRNWNSPLLPGTNGSAALLAEELRRAGFASLRYDKRVVGPHAAENFQALAGKISLQSHVEELAGAVDLLAGQEFVDSRRIFALTNSEGAVHALNYQINRPPLPFAGIVLIAPPGRVMGEVARAQVVAQLAVLPNSGKLIEAYDAAIAHFQAGEDVAPDPAFPDGVRMLVQALNTPANLPFARQLWAVDTAAWLAQVTVPVLVVIGQKDIQVDWQADGEPLRAAAGPNVTFLFPGNANHVLKFEQTPRNELTAEATARYSVSEAKLDPEALEGILSWLQETA